MQSHGRDELAKSRQEAWRRWDFSKHDVLKVYVNNAEATELMMLGRIQYQYKNGVEEDVHFAGRCEFVDEGAGAKMKFFQGWVTRYE